MALLNGDKMKAAEAVAALNYTNPFLKERQELEKTILGRDYLDTGIVWNLRAGENPQDLNIRKIREKTAWLIEKMGREIGQTKKPVPAREEKVYADMVIYHLFESYMGKFYTYIGRENDAPLGFYSDFLSDIDRLTRIPGNIIVMPYAPEHIFAMFFQIHRAFHYIFRFIIGGSLPTARLRAAVWQSIFTHDMLRYGASLFNRMNDITTLITGPSGTGKELVARVIAFCRYVPFDADKLVFEEKFTEQFFPLHLSALAQNLIESELFGHKRGAFTGALEDRIGRLEVSSQFGTVFLDEIGEINREIQVKLLRLLQDRSFRRLGENKMKTFKGKVIAATNRNLQDEMREGRFRADLYYRICADMITTPSLREQLDDSPDELENLVNFLCIRILGEDGAVSLVKEVLGWMKKNLPANYEWPGNVRELEQCVFNVLVRGSYKPPERQTKKDDLLESISAGTLTADEVLNKYCLLIYGRTKNYCETARILELDRRTVKSRIEKQIPADA